MSIQPNPSGGALQGGAGGAVQGGGSSSLADVLATILDKGIVVDVFARVSLVGIELLRVDVRVVIASVDTYLRFAEAANRLEMGAKEPEDLTSVVGQITGGGGRQQQGQDEGGRQQQGQAEDESEQSQPALESGSRDGDQELDQQLRSNDRGVDRERQPARRGQQEGRR